MGLNVLPIISATNCKVYDIFRVLGFWLKMNNNSNPYPNQNPETAYIVALRYTRAYKHYCISTWKIRQKRCHGRPC